ncbi:hypothetical protein F2Q68_00003987 [Brassica cretica]|uniref:Uncharacterized protein n=1 Tax=Brassica cretica TaxID=69181 RepID=A0A8S9JN07_BRACR|nr:hypothetical protein F2Q68_00003987 [Brassica cretica]
MIEIKYPFARIHLVCVGVSIGVLGGICKHLGSKREWNVLVERVGHRSGKWERPTTPAPDEMKAARSLAAGFGTRSEPTPRRHLSRMRATKTERGPQPARKNEETKLAFRATSRGGVRHPLWKQNDLVERPHTPARVPLILIGNLCFIWAFQVVD